MCHSVPRLTGSWSDPRFATCMQLSLFVSCHLAPIIYTLAPSPRRISFRHPHPHHPFPWYRFPTALPFAYLLIPSFAITDLVLPRLPRLSPPIHVFSSCVSRGPLQRQIATTAADKHTDPKFHAALSSPLHAISSPIVLEPLFLLNPIRDVTLHQDITTSSLPLVDASSAQINKELVPSTFVR